MTAKEAHDLASSKNNEDCKAQVESISKYVKRRCLEGEFNLHWYDPILPCVEIMLRSLGYTIKVIPDPKDGDFYNITW